MARDLRMNVDADASGARRGLDSTARALDNVADQARQVERSFIAASGAAVVVAKRIDDVGDQARQSARSVALLKTELAGLSRKSMSGGKSSLFDFTEQAAKSGTAAAGTFASFFQGGILSALKTPGGAAAAAVIAVPAAIGAGAMAGGLVGGGVSAGLAGAAAAGAAAQSKAVHRAWSIEIEGIKAEFLSATAGAEQPTIAAVRRIGAAVRGLHMDQVFGDATKFIGPLSAGLADGILAAGRGIERFVARSGPYVDALAEGARQIGQGFEIAFDEISGGAEGGGMALRDFAHIIATTVAVGGRFIGWAEDAYAAVDDLSQKMRALPQVDLMANALGQGNDPKSFARKLDFSGMKPDLGPIVDGLGDLKGAATGAADAMQQINDQFGRMFGNVLTTAEAADRYQQALIDLKKSIQENGKVVDGNSQAAIRNRDAIRDVITTIGAQRDAAVAAAGGTQAAWEQANAVYLRQLEDLRAQLVAWHLNTAAIDEMISKLKQIPSKIETQYDIKVRVATVGSTTINGKRVPVGEGGTIPIKGAFAEGGPVPGPAGSPALILAHGGEYVLSRDMLRGAAALPDTSALARYASPAGAGARSATPSLVYRGGTPAGLEAIFLSWLMKKVQNGDLPLVTA